ncbi:MAG: hypothetical protein JWM27_4450 [Gemmatimonadetes bacterium]|nr:hypothetical protein [Gemmatimonadota bacterium]
MKKIKLDIDALEVESFSVEGEGGAAARGTVHGRLDEAEAEGVNVVDVLASLASPLGCVASVAGCSVAWTCPASCGITCGNTCGPFCTVGYSCNGTCGSCSPNCTQVSYCAGQ